MHAYSTSATNYQIEADWTAFFTNTDNALYTDSAGNNIGCRLTCTLWETGACGTTSMVTSNVVLGSTPNFSISMKQNVVAGWNTEICVRCEQAFSSTRKVLDFDGWRIRQSVDCTQVLSAAGS